jgi:hypothetical protein
MRGKRYQKNTDLPLQVSVRYSVRDDHTDDDRQDDDGSNSDRSFVTMYWEGGENGFAQSQN